MVREGDGRWERWGEMCVGMCRQKKRDDVFLKEHVRITLFFFVGFCGDRTKQIEGCGSAHPRVSTNFHFNKKSKKKVQK